MADCPGFGTWFQENDWELVRLVDFRKDSIRVLVRAHCSDVLSAWRMRLRSASGLDEGMLETHRAKDEIPEFDNLRVCTQPQSPFVTHMIQRP